MPFNASSVCGTKTDERAHALLLMCPFPKTRWLIRTLPSEQQNSKRRTHNVPLHPHTWSSFAGTTISKESPEPKKMPCPWWQYQKSHPSQKRWARESLSIILLDVNTSFIVALNHPSWGQIIMWRCRAGASTTHGHSLIIHQRSLPKLPNLPLQ